MYLWPSVFPAKRTGCDFPSWTRARPCWITSPAWLWKWVKYQTLQQSPLTSSITAESHWEAAGRNGVMCWALSSFEMPSKNLWGPRCQAGGCWESAHCGNVDGCPPKHHVSHVEPDGTPPAPSAQLRASAGAWHGTWAPTSHKGIPGAPLSPFRDHKIRMVWIGRDL